jgi:serine/threonine protein kinase
VTADLGADLQTHLGAGHTVERELGGGGMSRVFVVQDHKLDRRVVIKVLSVSLTATLSLERFKREIMLSAGLQHPHIVPVLDAGELAGLPYFIMPYIDGESLRARIMRGPLSVRETVSVMKDVARALAFAHGRDVVHRDIKPDNILLAATSAMVTDFGVAKALTAAREKGTRSPSLTITGVGISLGTPAYMAPEQAAADPSVDHRADLYALGIVAYEMLVGAPPFHGQSPQAILAAQLSEEPPPLASRRYDIPVALAELIMRCLEKEPARRPKSAAELARALDSPDVVSGAFALPPATQRRRKRKRWRYAAATLATALAVTAMLVMRTDEPEPAEEAPVAISTSPPGRSIAVLPLVSAGGDQNDTGMAIGLASELTNALGQVPGLRVASQTAATAARVRFNTPGDIGRALNVAMLLEGTVQRQGERVRVTVRLVNVANDSTVWAQRFEGESRNVFALQDTLSRAVVAAVAGRP